MAEIDEKWNFYKLVNDVISSEENTINFCQRKGLIPKIKYCNNCGSAMKSIIEKNYNSKHVIFKCYKRQCRGKPGHKKYATVNTWFSGHRISIQTILAITYFFTTGNNDYNSIRNECSNITNSKILSNNTISDWLNYCREICLVALDKLFEVQGKIGGPGHTVQIDETKIGKRKYNKGRLVEGKWLLGFIDENTNDLRLDFCDNNMRDFSTLIKLIEKHVEKGTEIITDCWKGYIGLENYGYIHKTVNHSLNFVDPLTGVHTQKIESQWRALKRYISGGGIPQDKLFLHICEYMWKRYYLSKNIDLFSQFIRELNFIYSD